MIAILSIIILTSFWILGIKVVTSEDMALEKIAKWADKKVEAGYIIFEPLVLCPYCMPSIHSAFAYLAYWQIVGFESWKILLAYPFVVGGAGIISGTVWSLHNLLTKKHEYYDITTKYYEHAEKEKYNIVKRMTEEYKLKQSKK